MSQLPSAAVDGWFTVDGIGAGAYAISEYGHWEKAHSYLVMGTERAALVDSGLGIGDISAVVHRLTELPVVVLTTHAHWDHTGGHRHFDDVRVHPADADWLRHGIPVPTQEVRRTLLREAFNATPPASFEPETWEPFRGEPTALLSDGDQVDLGGRTLRVLHTPGHSPGHLCFHDGETGLLFTGDLVYRGCLYAFYPGTDPVAFAASVQHIADLPHVRRLLPGHNELENLNRDLLLCLAERLDDLRGRGELRHGTGVHRFSELGVSVRF